MMADESVFLLQQQLEKAKESLLSVDENIRRLTGREPGERRSAGDLRRVSVGGSSTGRGPLGQRQDAFQRLGPSPAKRPNLGSAFSRLGSRVGGAGSMRRPLRRRGDSDEEDTLPHKPVVQSSVVAAPKSIRTRKDSIEEQNKDSEGNKRNRRMFGLLLGTLQQFKAESSHTTEKDKRRDKIEKKLEQKASEEKEALANERKFLFLERKAKQAKLEELEQLMELAKEQDDWDIHAKNLNCFIRTKAKPHVFYKPKRASQISDKRHAESKGLIRDQTHKRRVEIEEEIKKAGAEEDGEEEKEDRKRRKTSEGRSKEGKEGDKGKLKERRRHSEGRVKDNKYEGDDTSRGGKRNGIDHHRDNDGKERDRRDDGRKRRRSGRSREDEESMEAGGDGKKEQSRDSGKNRDRHRSRTSSEGRMDKEAEKEEEKADEEKTKEESKKAEEEEDKEEGEVMDTDEHSSKQTDSVESKIGGEEVPESEQVGEVSSSNDAKDKEQQQQQQQQEKEEKQEENKKEAEKDTENTTDDQVPMEEGETKDEDDEKSKADL